MDAAAIDAIAARHPEAFRISIWKRYSAPLGILACILYSLYCFWFFSVGAVLEKANWHLAGIYLADWVSYEIRPDIEFEDGYLTIGYSRFSELGANPNPDWVIKETATIDRRVEARPATVQPARPADNSLMAPGAATAETAAPQQQEAAAPQIVSGRGRRQGDGRARQWRRSSSHRASSP